MSEPASAPPVPNAALMRSLGRLVRGLSALFWGLPLALVACVWTASPQWVRSFGVVPPLVCTAWLLYGLTQLGAFQSQERVWRAALDRARLVGLATCGLSPFLYWWSRMPANLFFTVMVAALALCGLLFLASLNVVLQRLGAMLPDEALRLEIRQFTALNLNLLLVLFLVFLAYLVMVGAELNPSQTLPPWLGALTAALERSAGWFPILILLMVLLPVAMTMALLWKTKEVILENVFGPK